MNLIELRGELVERHKREREELFTRHRSELESFDAKGSELMKGLMALVNGSAATPVTPERNGHGRGYIAGLRKAVEALSGEFTRKDIEAVAPKPLPPSFSSMLSYLKRDTIETVRYGVYRKKFETGAVASTVPATEKATPQVNGRCDTDCARAIRRAISVMVMEKPTFTRDELFVRMKLLVPERDLLGWNASGGFASALLDLRENGQLSMTPGFGGKPPIFERGEKFVAVNE